jgi:hypothetical protein
MSTVTTKCPRIYTVNPANGRILKSGVDWTSIGVTLYLFQTSTDGYHRRIMSEACSKGFTSVRCVLMFEGAAAIEDDVPWDAVESILKLAEEMDMAVTVEAVSALTSWLERKDEHAYDEKWDELYEYVIGRSVKQFSSYSSLFLVTVLNEVIPFRGVGFEPEPMFRRLLQCAKLYKKKAPTLLVGSGGLLHMGKESGGRVPYVKVPWLEDGSVSVPYWQGVYTAPNVDVDMLHIYSTVEKILDSKSEWSNVVDYTSFCKKNGRAFIVDEFGLKLDFVTIPKDKPKTEQQAKLFLQAVSSTLRGNGIGDLPQVLQYWNHSINAQGYDWFPTYTPEVFDTFEEEFEDVGYFMPNRKTRKYSFNPWQIRNVVVLHERFGKEYEYPPNFKVEKVLSVSGKETKQVKHVVAEVFVDPTKSVPTNMLFRFQLKVRELNTNRVFTKVQKVDSWRQNQVVPMPEQNKPRDKQYIFARLALDFNENLMKDDNPFQIERVDVYMVKFKTNTTLKGYYVIRNLKFITF